jgi:hypothetical protein
MGFVAFLKKVNMFIMSAWTNRIRGGSSSDVVDMQLFALACMIFRSITEKK